MSMRRLSPTANLLRNSRLFSLPPPLPRPSSDLTATANFESDTATLPYPTHAAIETPDSSLGRGDWGLKRPLPLKSTTRTSTPTIHIDNVDSIDHITDFDSAADHALTLRKWQELDMPISLKEQGGRASGTGTQKPPKSVFESHLDNTESGGSDRAKGRWKFKGPWLAGKTEGEFQEYLEKKVKRRKLHFRQWLGARLAQAKSSNQRREATARGEDVNDAEVPVSEEEIETFIMRLRNDEQAMHKLVEEFLDLPTELEGPGIGQNFSTYEKEGPPTTHPSAGLSYLRTASHTVNHPMYGPQEYKTPVEGRVIASQFVRGSRQARALIGVAGVVAKDLHLTFWKESKPGPNSKPGIDRFDPDIPGGAKLWVTPTRASVSSQGRIDMFVDRANKHALNVLEGTEEEEAKLPAAAIAAAQDRETPLLNSSAPRREGRAQYYGMGGMSGASSSVRARPLLGPDDPMPEQSLNDLLRGAMSANTSKRT